MKKDVKSNPLNELTIAITDKEDLDFDTKTNTVFLCYEILALGIKSKGKLEINMSSYVAFKLNSKLNLSLYHNLFSFAFEKDPKLVNIYTENYSKNMLSMVD